MTPEPKEVTEARTWHANPMADAAEASGHVADLLRVYDALTTQSQRLHDLVRHQRGPLHDADLITDDEYARLAADHGAVARLESYDALIAKLREVAAERDGAVMHSITLQEANVTLLRWQSTAPAPHLDHLLAMVRSLAASDEGPRALRECSAAGVEAEIHRAFAAERINREKSEHAAADARKASEAMEARALDAERERDEARAEVGRLAMRDGIAASWCPYDGAELTGYGCCDVCGYEDRR